MSLRPILRFTVTTRVLADLYVVRRCRITHPIVSVFITLRRCTALGGHGDSSRWPSMRGRLGRPATSSAPAALSTVRRKTVRGCTVAALSGANSPCLVERPFQQVEIAKLLPKDARSFRGAHTYNHSGGIEAIDVYGAPSDNAIDLDFLPLATANSNSAGGQASALRTGQEFCECQRVIASP